jgi:cephalosporin hydroxylase
MPSQKTGKVMNGVAPADSSRQILDRFDILPHIEDCMSMTLREWMLWHNVMHRHYTRYMGRKILKPPFDWIVLGDIIQDTRPELIIEIGSYEGGSALWMAHLLDTLGSDAPIIGVDISGRPTPVEHPRIKWVIGDAREPDIIKRVDDLAGGRRGMVIEDSDHKAHVTLALLNEYARFVARGCYFIVEDTIVEALQIPPFPGPLEAVREFIANHGEEFTIDRAREKYIMTNSPMGYLYRTAA